MKRLPIIRHIRATIAALRYGWAITLWEPRKPPNHFGRLRNILKIADGKD